MSFPASLAVTSKSANCSGPFECLLCSYRSDRKSNLDQHVKTIHERTKEFACDQCSYRSSRSSNVNQHKRTVHDGKKDHVCGLCSFKSSRKFNLTQHIDRVHKDQAEAALDPINQQQQHNLPQRQFQQQHNVRSAQRHQIMQQQQQQQQQQQHHISLNPPTMVGSAATATTVGLRVGYEQQQMRPHQQLTVAFPQQTVMPQYPQLQMQPQSLQIQQQQQQQQNTPKTPKTNRRKSMSKSFSCRFCQYSTMKEEALRAHVVACHPGIAAATAANSTTTAAAAAVAALTSPLVNLPNQPAFASHAVSGIDHFLSATSRAAAAATVSSQQPQPPPPLSQINPAALSNFMPLQQQQLKKRQSQVQTSAKKVSASAHPAGKIFRCDICSFSSAYDRNLKAHVREVHLKEKRVHKCHICDTFKSSRRSNLMQHIRTVHEGVKGFRCHVCGLEASRRRVLEQHMSKAHMIKLEVVQE